MTIFEYPKSFWYETADRGIKSFFQSILVTIGGIQVVPALQDVPWTTAIPVAGTYAVVSILTSIVSGAVGTLGDASIIEPPE